MRRVFSLLGILAAMHGWAAMAAVPNERPTDQPIVINFNILPGSQVQGQPVKRSFGFTLTPGQSYSDSVLIVNPSKTSSLTVKLSVSDAVTSPHNGGLTYNDTHNQHQLGRWLQLAATNVTVPPYSMTRVPIFLTLPASVQPGEYEGSINATDTRPVMVPSGKVKVGILLDRRCFVRLQVPGVAPIGLSIAQVGTTGAHASPVVYLTLKNTGTVIDYPVAAVLTFIGPSKAYTVQSRVGLVMGGDSTVLALAIGRVVPGGTYQVTVRVAYVVTSSSGANPQRLQATWSGRLVVP